MINFWNITKGIHRMDAWATACWVQVTMPTEAENTRLITEYGVPAYFLADIADADERARFDSDNGWLLIILRIPYKRNVETRTPYVTIPMGILLNGDKIITVCHQRTEMLDNFITYQQKRGVGFIDANDMVFRLFLCAAVWYNKYLRQINDLIEQAKFNLEGKKIANSDLISLSRLQDTLTYFATSIRGNENLLAKVRMRLLVDDLDAELIEDVNTETNQARETNWIYINILNSIMETNANIINNDMNSVMRLLTALNIIIMLPSLIASLLGMNLLNGMEESPLGFPIALVLCTLSIVASYRYFRRKSWL